MFYSINGKSTREGAYIVRPEEYNGLQFSGFDNLEIRIARSGELNIGKRKIIYEAGINYWQFTGKGNYSVNGSAADDAIEFNLSANGTVSGGEGRDVFVFGGASTGSAASPTAIRISDFDHTKDILDLAFWYGYGTSQTDLELLSKNIEVIHAGTGATAQTKITIYNPKRDGSSIAYLNGHLDIDGIEGYWENNWAIYLKPTANLKIGNIELPPLNGGGSSASNGGDTQTGTPTYALVASSSNASEGNVASFILTTTNVAAGTSISYGITGLSAVDIVGGRLEGSTVVDAQGKANIIVSL